MKYKILIGCMLCLFSFIPKGAANLVLNPYTSQEISADSIIERVMTFAPSYESIVSDYRANLYIKGKMNIQKKNFILRYVPSMFRLQKGVREYLLETYSDLHYTAPNIYDQKVKASQGTVRGNRGLPGLLEYFSVNIYSSSLLNDERLLSPLAKNGQKYYKYRIDSVMGDPNNLDYRIRFIPRTKSDQLVGGYMIVSSNVWSVREIRFSGRSELITFTCWIKMGEVGKKDEFLPIRYDVEALFKFLGNKVDGNYTASLDYKSIELKERKVRKKEKKKYNLSESTEEIMKEWYDAACKAYTDKVVLKPYAKTFIEQMHNNGLKIVSATSSDRALFEPCLRRNGIYGFFDAFTQTNEVSRGKKFPDVYMKAAGKAGCSVNECIVFEDVLSAAQGAKSGGFTVVAVYDEASADDWPDICRIADYNIRSYSELM